ncbi:hypothetical protein B5X24_HaOG207623 [Helicoverpa armigera]|uniref:Roadblock/LAMTOR2 domain-containing protein n=1 Tax=Helicoverpa armigera TaxID=29058 RepID=A0A2W1BLR7_HELAM|nr:hypothetical protein B5X24_HaOG207623 [Helicoverpa armigera]
MPRRLFRKFRRREWPKEFSQVTTDTIDRIELNLNVIGLMYFREDEPIMHTMPRIEEVVLASQLPSLGRQIRNSIKEVDIMDDLVAYRIVTKSNELLVASDAEFSACVLQKLKPSEKEDPHKHMH